MAPDRKPTPDEFDTLNAEWATLGAGTPHPQEWVCVEKDHEPYFLLREPPGRVQVFTREEWRARLLQTDWHAS